MMASASADGLVGAGLPVNCALIARFHGDGTRLLPNDGSKGWQMRTTFASALPILSRVVDRTLPTGTPKEHLFTLLLVHAGSRRDAREGT
jgi:hypothetical protein